MTLTETPVVTWVPIKKTPLDTGSITQIHAQTNLQ